MPSPAPRIDGLLALLQASDASLGYVRTLMEAALAGQGPGAGSASQGSQDSPPAHSQSRSGPQTSPPKPSQGSGSSSGSPHRSQASEVTEQTMRPGIDDILGCGDEEDETEPDPEEVRELLAQLARANQGGPTGRWHSDADLAHKAAQLLRTPMRDLQQRASGLGLLAHFKDQCVAWKGIFTQETRQCPLIGAGTRLTKLQLIEVIVLQESFPDSYPVLSAEPEAAEQPPAAGAAAADDGRTALTEIKQQQQQEGDQREPAEKPQPQPRQALERGGAAQRQPGVGREEKDEPRLPSPPRGGSPPPPRQRPARPAPGALPFPPEELREARPAPPSRPPSPAQAGIETPFPPRGRRRGATPPAPRAPRAQQGVGRSRRGRQRSASAPPCARGAYHVLRAMLPHMPPAGAHPSFQQGLYVLPLCPRDRLCQYVDCPQHQQHYRHTCRLRPCTDGAPRHGVLFAHSPASEAAPAQRVFQRRSQPADGAWIQSPSAPAVGNTLRVYLPKETEWPGLRIGAHNVVMSVLSGGAFARAGAAAFIGRRITAVNGKRVSDVADVSKHIITGAENLILFKPVQPPAAHPGAEPAAGGVPDATPQVYGMHYGSPGGTNAAATPTPPAEDGGPPQLGGAGPVPGQPAARPQQRVLYVRAAPGSLLLFNKHDLSCLLLRANWARVKLQQLHSLVQQHMHIPVAQQMITTRHGLILSNPQALCSGYGIAEGSQLLVADTSRPVPRRVQLPDVLWLPAEGPPAAEPPPAVQPFPPPDFPEEQQGGPAPEQQQEASDQGLPGESGPPASEPRVDASPPQQPAPPPAEGPGPDPELLPPPAETPLPEEPAVDGREEAPPAGPRPGAAPEEGSPPAGKTEAGEESPTGAPTRTPPESTATPDLTITPDPNTVPEEPVTTPDGPTTTAEDPATTAEEPTTTPEGPTAVPEEPTTTPEEPTTTPEGPTAMPEEPTTTPEEPTTTPEEPEGPTTPPEEPTTTPEEPTTTPEEPTTVPEGPTTTPEEPTATPEQPTATPEQPTAAPGGPAPPEQEPAPPPAGEPREGPGPEEDGMSAPAPAPPTEGPSPAGKELKDPAADPQGSPPPGEDCAQPPSSADAGMAAESAARPDPGPAPAAECAEAAPEGAPGGGSPKGLPAATSRSSHAPEQPPGSPRSPPGEQLADSPLGTPLPAEAAEVPSSAPAEPGDSPNGPGHPAEVPPVPPTADSPNAVSVDSPNPERPAEPPEPAALASAGAPCAAPEQAEPAPEQAEPAPEQAEPAPEQAEPAPGQAEPAPEQAHPAAEQAHPAAEQAHPASEQAHPASEQAQPAPEQPDGAAPHAAQRTVRDGSSPRSVPDDDPAVRPAASEPPVCPELPPPPQPAALEQHLEPPAPEQCAAPVSAAGPPSEQAHPASREIAAEEAPAGSGAELPEGRSAPQQQQQHVNGVAPVPEDPASPPRGRSGSADAAPQEPLPETPQKGRKPGKQKSKAKPKPKGKGKASRAQPGAAAAAELSAEPKRGDKDAQEGEWRQGGERQQEPEKAPKEEAEEGTKGGEAQAASASDPIAAPESIEGAGKEPGISPDSKEEPRNQPEELEKQPEEPEDQPKEPEQQPEKEPEEPENKPEETAQHPEQERAGKLETQPEEEPQAGGERDGRPAGEEPPSELDEDGPGMEEQKKTEEPLAGAVQEAKEAEDGLGRESAERATRQNPAVPDPEADSPRQRPAEEAGAPQEQASAGAGEGRSRGSSEAARGEPSEEHAAEREGEQLQPRPPPAAGPARQPEADPQPQRREPQPAPDAPVAAPAEAQAGRASDDSSRHPRPASGRPLSGLKRGRSLGEAEGDGQGGAPAAPEDSGFPPGRSPSPRPPACGTIPAKRQRCDPAPEASAEGGPPEPPAPECPEARRLLGEHCERCFAEQVAQGLSPPEEGTPERPAWRGLIAANWALQHPELARRCPQTVQAAWECTRAAGGWGVVRLTDELAAVSRRLAAALAQPPAAAAASQCAAAAAAVILAGCATTADWVCSLCFQQNLATDCACSVCGDLRPAPRQAPPPGTNSPTVSPGLRGLSPVRRRVLHQRATPALPPLFLYDDPEPEAEAARDTPGTSPENSPPREVLLSQLSQTQTPKRRKCLHVPQLTSSPTPRAPPAGERRSQEPLSGAAAENADQEPSPRSKACLAPLPITLARRDRSATLHNPKPPQPSQPQQPQQRQPTPPSTDRPPSSPERPEPQAPEKHSPGVCTPQRPSAARRVSRPLVSLGTPQPRREEATKRKEPEPDEAHSPTGSSAATSVATPTPAKRRRAQLVSLSQPQPTVARPQEQSVPKAEPAAAQPAEPTPKEEEHPAVTPVKRPRKATFVAPTPQKKVESGPPSQELLRAALRRLADRSNEELAVLADRLDQGLPLLDDRDRAFAGSYREKLHKYNRVKDATQQLIGQLASLRGMTVGAVHKEFNVA